MSEIFRHGMSPELPKFGEMEGVSKMAQTAILRETSPAENWIGVVSLVASGIANWIAITAFIAPIVKQDPLLIFFMTVAAVVIAGLVYLVRSHVTRVSVFVALLVSLVLAIVAWSLLASVSATPVNVSIVDPQDGANVTMHYTVKGTVSDRDARVDVIVHPIKVPDLWVQQTPMVSGQGDWQSTVYFGTDTIGIGDRYEVVAIATSDNFLVKWASGYPSGEGQKITTLPNKSNRSNIITVTRAK